MGAPKGNRFAVGARGGLGGQRKAPEFKDFYAAIDHGSLYAVKFCTDVLKDAQNLYKENTKWLDAGLKAAQIIISKAPERVTGADGGPLKWQITWGPLQTIYDGSARNGADRALHAAPLAIRCPRDTGAFQSGGESQTIRKDELQRERIDTPSVIK